MDLQKLIPKRHERMMIVGRTGSGKSTLADRILSAADYGAVLIIDPKCYFPDREPKVGYEIVTSPQQLKGMGKRYTHIQFRPDPRHQNVEDYELVYEWAYRRQNILVYTDELYLTMHGTRSPDWQRACITSGRQLGVGMVMCSQRPRGVDPRVRTEADVKAQFDLEEEEDAITFWSRIRAKRLEAALTDRETGEYLGMPKFSFWFHRPEMGRMPRLTRLRLE